MMLDTSKYAQQLKRFLLPGANDVHHDWLEPLILSNWLHKCINSKHANKLLSKNMRRQYQLDLPDKHHLNVDQHWLLMGLQEQNELAKTIGGEVCLAFVRRVIHRDAIKSVQTQLGKKFYDSLLTSEGIAASGITQSQFDKHLEQRSLEIFFIATGIAGLLHTIDSNNDFFKIRMKFAFPKRCWESRPNFSHIDKTALASVLLRFNNAIDPADKADE